MKGNLALLINGERHELEVLERTRSSVRFRYQGREYAVEHADQAAVPETIASAPSSPKRVSRPGDRAAAGTVCAAMPGIVVDLLVQSGDSVHTGDVLLRIEAMKMQNSVFAPADGVVTAVHVQVGAEVGDGDLLLSIEPSGAAHES